MLAVDTSAIMAILLNEERAEACADALAGEDVVLISAATLAESLIVAASRGVGAAMQRLARGLGWQVVPVSEADAARVAEAYGRWGKGLHPAGLNYGDCFAYVLARTRSCALLFVGDDFARTDATSRLQDASEGGRRATPVETSHARR